LRLQELAAESDSAARGIVVGRAALGLRRHDHAIEAFEALAAPVVEETWAGKQLPFPVLLDGEGRTSGVYGIQGWPAVHLIDSEGHLVKDGKAD
jgi:hypothetical protein